MIARSWAGLRTTASAAAVGGHPQTVRERPLRFTAAGLAGRSDRLGAGRRPRLREVERWRVIALVTTEPPGRLVGDGQRMVTRRPAEPVQWSLDALVVAAQARGIRAATARSGAASKAAGVRWRPPRSWVERTDPAFAPQGRRSSPAPPSLVTRLRPRWCSHDDARTAVTPA
jgi:hypothetical protein